MHTRRSKIKSGLIAREIVEHFKMSAWLFERKPPKLFQ